MPFVCKLASGHGPELRSTRGKTGSDSISLITGITVEGEIMEEASAAIVDFGGIRRKIQAEMRKPHITFEKKHNRMPTEAELLIKYRAKRWDNLQASKIVCVKTD